MISGICLWSSKMSFHKIEDFIEQKCWLSWETFYFRTNFVGTQYSAVASSSLSFALFVNLQKLFSIEWIAILVFIVNPSSIQPSMFAAEIMW